MKIMKNKDGKIEYEELSGGFDLYQLMQELIQKKMSVQARMHQKDFRFYIPEYLWSFHSSERMGFMPADRNFFQGIPLMAGYETNKIILVHKDYPLYQEDWMFIEHEVEVKRYK